MEPCNQHQAVSVTRQNCPSPHSLGNKIGRTLWGIVWVLLFLPSPKLMFGWRRFLLRLFGAKVGRGAKIMPAARIWAPWNLAIGDHGTISFRADCYCVDKIHIGAHATVSQSAHLCTASHDIADPHMCLVTAPIVIGDGAWIGAGAFVGMGTTIGDGAIAAARAVVTRDVEPWTVVGGNPAEVIKKRVLHS